MGVWSQAHGSVEPGAWECGICTKVYNLDEIDETEVLLDACDACIANHNDPLGFAIARLLDRHTGHVLADAGDRQSLYQVIMQVILYLGDL